MILEAGSAIDVSSFFANVPALVMGWYPGMNGGNALAWEADENSTAITNFSGYSRQVRVTDCGSGAGCMGIVDAGMRLVTVTVSYTPPSVTGTAATSATAYSVSMLVSQQ